MYENAQEVSRFLTGLDLTINRQDAGDMSPAHIKYDCTLTKGGSTFDTTYQSNPKAHGTPTETDVFSAIVLDALSAHDYTVDEFADEFGMKPSQAIRAHKCCTDSLNWLTDGLALRISDLRQMGETLDENLDEIKGDVKAAKEEEAEKEAYDNPPVPEGFVTIAELQGELDLGDYGDQCPDYTGDYVCDCFTEVADSNVDISNYDLLKWLPDNAEWLEEADAQGLLEGCKGDIYKMVQMAQYECYTQDLYDHQEDIGRYATLEALKDSGCYALSTDVAQSILEDIDFSDNNDRFSDYLDSAQQMIADALTAEITAQLGDTDKAEQAMDDITAKDGNSSIFRTINPCAMGVDSVRTANEQGGVDSIFPGSLSDYLAQDADKDGKAPSLAQAANETRASASELEGSGHDGKGQRETESER